MRWVLKRWWFWGGAGFILVTLVAGYLLIPVSEDRISQASCDKIQRGWTRAQVYGLLGRPFGESFGREVWVEEGSTIFVRFDSQGGVSKVEFIPFPTSNSAYQRMKFRIERRIEALWP